MPCHDLGMADQTVAEALRAKITDRGVTQAEAARQMGTDEPNVSRWLSGSIPARPHHPAIMRFLEIDRPAWAILMLTSAERQWDMRHGG